MYPFQLFFLSSENILTLFSGFLQYLKWLPDILIDYMIII